MLDKILNINPKEKYKSGTKNSANHFYGLYKNPVEKKYLKDAAYFSPIAQLLSRLNWQIINIHRLSDEEIIFNFLVNNFEFYIIIKFKELYSNPFQKIQITQFENLNKTKAKYELQIDVNKDKISTLEKPDDISTKFINKLFLRIGRLEMKSNVDIIQKHILDDLIEGIEYSLQEELNYILKIIYTYISKQDNSKIRADILLKSDENIPIMLHKVSISYSE